MNREITWFSKRGSISVINGVNVSIFKSGFKVSVFGGVSFTKDFNVSVLYQYKNVVKITVSTVGKGVD